MKRKKITSEKHDKLLRVADSNSEGLGEVVIGSWPREVTIAGDLGIGKKGNSVTIMIEDEVTGETLEVSGVRNAFFVIQDTRKNSSGWLAMVVGKVEKVSEVLGFLTQVTLDSLKKMVSR